MRAVGYGGWCYRGNTGGIVEDVVVSIEVEVRAEERKRGKDRRCRGHSSALTPFAREGGGGGESQHRPGSRCFMAVAFIYIHYPY